MLKFLVCESKRYPSIKHMRITYPGDTARFYVPRLSLCGGRVDRDTPIDINPKDICITCIEKKDLLERTINGKESQSH